jgi:hypothetical protein
VYFAVFSCAAIPTAEARLEPIDAKFGKKDDVFGACCEFARRGPAFLPEYNRVRKNHKHKCSKLQWDSPFKGSSKALLI